MTKLLIVDDDLSLCNSLVELLSSVCHKVETAHNGRDALEFLLAFEYDAIVLDWEMPEISGLELLRQFREHGGHTPILMLTGKGDIEAKQLGFEAGADDYLTKPFHPQELVSRIKALLRRPPQFTGAVITVGNKILDMNTRSFTRDGIKISLKPMEFELLEFLMRHPDQVFTTEAIIRRCWDSDADISYDAIYSCITRLRKKVDAKDQTSLITTVHGMGYRLNSQA